MIIDNKECEITEKFDIENITNNELKIKLKGLDNATNMSRIFMDLSLLSIPDISKWSSNNVNNMPCIFNGCSSLLFLPDISKWDTHNIKFMQVMFSECSSLLFLPDISKWNTENVIYIS